MFTAAVGIGSAIVWAVIVEFQRTRSTCNTTARSHDTRRIHHLCLLRSAGFACAQQAALHLLSLQHTL
jgi:hypothetical protein